LRWTVGFAKQRKLHGRLPSSSRYGILQLSVENLVEHQAPLCLNRALPRVRQIRDIVLRAELGVLIVDEDVDAAQSLAMLLRILGQDLRKAHNGRSALEAERASLPEIAILDIGLPGMNGHELARRLRDEPGGAAVLSIAPTGWGQDVDRRRSAEAGIDNHLTKPADPEFLRKLLSQAR
jgi:CheY-like chemotaxis protein